MPEGDTVFQTADRLRRALHGETLTRTDFRVPRFATLDLSGRTVDEVVSRGKHLLIRVGDVSIHSHLKMEGRWSVFTPGERWNRPAHLARAVLETPRSVAVGFELGLLEVVPREAEPEAVGHLGPDLLGPDWDAAEAVRRIRSSPDVPIAVALLDQRNLAGLGNVYVNELCFLRGIRPHRRVAEVPDVEAVVDLGRRLLVANRDRVSRVTTGVDRRGRSGARGRRRGRPSPRRRS